MLDWKEPLALDAVVDRGLAIFNAALPRAFALAVLGGLVANLVADRIIGPHEQEIAALVREGRLADFLDRFGLAFAGLSVLMLTVNGAVLYLIGTLARGSPVDAPDALGAVLRRLPQLLLGGLLYFVVLWVGLMLLLVPGLWAAVALSFFVQAVLFDGQDGARALALSFRLTRGHWWRTLALYALLIAVLLMVMLLTGMLVALVSAVTGMVAGGASLPLLELALASVIGSIVGIAVDSVLVAYYHDLKLRAGVGPRQDDGALVV